MRKFGQNIYSVGYELGDGMKLGGFKVGLTRQGSGCHLVDFHAIIALAWWAQQDERSKVALDD